MRLVRRIIRTFFPSLMVGVTLITSGIASAQKVAQKAAQKPAQKPAKKDPVSVRLPPAAFAAMETIIPDHIRWHVRYLSHDLLEGRGTGQRGGDIAAEYIATQFAEYGLKPAGDNGTYLQKVPLVGITALPETQFSLVPKQGAAMHLKPLDDYVAYDQTQQAQSDVDAEIVYVGYGIEAPEYNWDDYKGVDVRGKVLLMLVNEPPSDDPKFFKGKALTYYGRWTYKYEEAARKGAVGVILIHREDMASYPWEVVRNSNSGEKSYLKLEGAVLKVASWVHLDVAKKLAAASGMDLDKLMADARTRDFHPVNMGSKLKAHMVSKVRNFESNNVLAMLPGSNRKMKDEVVMYTAHYDHLGIRPDTPGDNIYNGAADNATGCGILLRSGPGTPGTIGDFRGGHSRRAGTAGVGVLGQASAGSGRQDCPGFELRRREAAGCGGRSRSYGRGAHHVLSVGAGDGERVPAGDPPGCAA